MMRPKPNRPVRELRMGSHQESQAPSDQVAPALATEKPSSLPKRPLPQVAGCPFLLTQLYGMVQALIIGSLQGRGCMYLLWALTAGII